MSYGQYSNAPKVEKPDLPAKTGKREKHVFGSGDTGVEHVWAHPLTKDGQGYSQTYGTNPQKNFYFKTDEDGTRVLYSYRDSYPIASRFVIGKRAVYLVRSGKGCSVTTSRHLNVARCAVPDKAYRFAVPYVTRYTQPDFQYSDSGKPDKATHMANLADYITRIQDEIDRQIKARSSWVITSAHTQAITLRDEAKRYARVFGLKCPKLPVIPKIDTVKLASIRDREAGATEAYETRQRIQELENIINSEVISVENGATPQYRDEILVEDFATCGVCGRTWNDALITSRTPAPAARCPYESIHMEIAELKRLRESEPASKKRILSIKIKRMIDTDPDTSYFGEYSDRATSEFSIDRAHSEDCASVRSDIRAAKETLEHVQQTIGDLHNAVLVQYNGTLANEKLDSERDALDEAYNLVGELFDEIDECDCGGHHYDSREYRYFNPNWQNYKGDTEENIRKYCKQDFDRMESYNDQQWSYIGIRAEAEYVVGFTGSVQHVTSGGLWGVESDSTRSDLESIEQEELSNLKTELLALGFSRRAISQAFKSIEEVSE